MSRGDSTLAPVALFAYRRPDHLRRVLEALADNPEAGSTEVVIHCDGASSPNHAEAVERTREVARRARGFGKVQVVERETNLGLSQSIIKGVGEMLVDHDRVIVLEDDLVVSSHFLAYMNNGLACYRDDPRVASIHGYCYPVRSNLPATFFLPGADCWGWATWKRAWSAFRGDGSALLAELREKGEASRFDFDGTYPYMRMLEDQIAGRNDSWAIRWYASAYLAGMFTLYPGRSLVANIGFDGTGEHCQEGETVVLEPFPGPVAVERIAIEESRAGREAFKGHFRALRGTWPERIRRFLSKMMGRVAA